MSERYTDTARRAVAQAEEEARLHGQAYIGTEHLLLALAAADGTARRLLYSLGASYEDLRKRTQSLVPPGEHDHEGHIPLTPRAEKVLQLASREALQLGHGYIGTEHILLALIREGDGVGVQVLGKYAPLPEVRAKMLRMLRSGGLSPERNVIPPAEGQRIERKLDMLMRHLGLDPDA